MARQSKTAGFLAQLRGKPEQVEVNGVPVHLRSLTVGELVALREAHAAAGNGDGAGLALSRRLVAASVIDPDTLSPLFDEADVDGLSVAALEQLADHIQRINGMKADDSAGKA